MHYHNRKKSLYTPYAEELISQQECFAREGVFTVEDRQGNGTYLLEESLKDDNTGNRHNGRDAPVARVERNTVDLKNKTCTCEWIVARRLPCKHVILCVDREGLRATLQGHYEFRKDWVAPYFWRENYRNGYQNMSIRTPDINNNTYVDVPKGKRVVTQPPKKHRKNQGPQKGATRRKRLLGSVVKRSRARFDEKGYVKRKRARNARSGPANPEVLRTNPTIFQKDPRGRKPLSYEQRMERFPEVERNMQEAIKLQEEKDARKSRRKNNKKRQRQSETPPIVISPVISATSANSTVNVSPVISTGIGSPFGIVDQKTLQLMQSQYIVQMQMFGSLMNLRPFGYL